MPGQRHELHHKICNLRYGTPGYGMSVYEITAKFKRFLLYKSHCSKAIQKWIAFLMSCVQRSWTTLAGVSPVTVIASEPCS